MANFVSATSTANILAVTRGKVLTLTMPQSAFKILDMPMYSGTSAGMGLSASASHHRHSSSYSPEVPACGWQRGPGHKLSKLTGAAVNDLRATLGRAGAGLPRRPIIANIRRQALASLEQDGGSRPASTLGGRELLGASAAQSDGYGGSSGPGSGGSADSSKAPGVRFRLSDSEELTRGGVGVAGAGLGGEVEKVWEGEGMAEAARRSSSAEESVAAVLEEEATASTSSSSDAGEEEKKGEEVDKAGESPGGGEKEGEGADSTASSSSQEAGDKEAVEQDQGPEESDSRFMGLKVFVAGANGRTGRAVVESLVKRSVPVRALVRDASKAGYLRQLSGVTVVEGDVYKYETLIQALGESNAIIVATGAVPTLFDPLAPYKTDYEGTQNLVALAKNSGDIKKFVYVTSLGVSLLLFPVNLLGGILLWKKLAEQVLQRSGLPYTIIRPGGLLSSIPKGRNIVMRPADTLFGGGIARAQVAEVCVTALVNSAATGKIAEVVSEFEAPERSVDDLFESL